MTAKKSSFFYCRNVKKCYIYVVVNTTVQTHKTYKKWKDFHYTVQSTLHTVHCTVHSKHSLRLALRLSYSTVLQEWEIQILLQNKSWLSYFMLQKYNFPSEEKL